MIPAKVSSCVDCATPIIGDRLRCSACHDRHAADLAARDDDTTLPRSRSVVGRSSRGALPAWIGACLTIVGAVVLLVVAAALVALVVRSYL